MNKNKFKLLSGYFIGIICSFLITTLVVLLIFKFTIYKKEYIKNVLVEVNYYTEIYDDTMEEMKGYMTSSGLDEEILDGLFSVVKIHHDVDKYIDSVYKGKIYKYNSEKFREKLNSNIDASLVKHNISVTDRSELDSFVDSITGIYEDEITLYKTINPFISKIYKLGKLLNIIIIINLLSVIGLLLLLFKLKFKYISSTVIASGLMMLFIRFAIYDKIDIKNILIISKYFSIALRKILLSIGNCLTILGFFAIIGGLFMAVCSSYKKSKKRHKK